MFGRFTSCAEGQTHGRRIEQALDQYQQAMQSENSRFSAQLVKVQQWQADRLISEYQHIFDDKVLGRTARFMLEEVYSGALLHQISEEIRLTARKAWRLLPANIMLAAAQAVEATALTLNIDATLARATLPVRLVQGNDIRVVTPLQSTEYVHALRATRAIELRREQLQVFAQLAKSIDFYVSKSSLHVGLKMTTGLAERAGVANLHHFLLRACSLIKVSGALSPLIAQISQLELTLLDQVEKGLNPWSWMDQSLKSVNF